MFALEAMSAYHLSRESEHEEHKKEQEQKYLWECQRSNSRLTPRMYSIWKRYVKPDCLEICNKQPL